MLEINRLDVSLGKKKIIENLDLPPIRSGEVTAIVGPNGAGKSTLLKAIAGIAGFSGSIRLHGADLAAMPAAERAARIGFMPQMTASRAGLTVLEATMNVLMMAGAARWRGDRDAAAHEAMKWLDRIGLTGLALSPLSSLSGGQRQLASLAQTLVFAPQAVLLDEPTSALDLGHQVRVMGIVRRFAADGGIAVAVLHDLALASRHADRIVMLHGGRLAAFGTPAKVLTPALLRDVYGVEVRVTPDGDGGVHISVDAETRHDLP